jgi:unsaturated rhamnogalacturonyl hydrolase
MGQYVVYKRTGNEQYFNYIKNWTNRFVDVDGNLNATIDSLDSMQSGNILLAMYSETKEERYKAAAETIRGHIDEYPRIANDAFWHAFWAENQIWADGVFMVNPFLSRFSHLFNDQIEYSYNETTNQVLAYADILQQDSGLFLHAYSEPRDAEWADPTTGLSPEAWCRAMGWWGLTVTDLLNVLPEDHANRPKVLEKFHLFLNGISEYQDEETGRWFQIVNRPDDEDNWTETSTTAMFTYTTKMALDKGWIEDEDGKFERLVNQGQQGVLDRIVKNDDGNTDVLEIVIGTGVGNRQHYYDRPRETNDLHGTGAVYDHPTPRPVPLPHLTSIANAND